MLAGTVTVSDVLGVLSITGDGADNSVAIFSHTAGWITVLGLTTSGGATMLKAPGGTPHQGINAADVASIVVNFASASGNSGNDSVVITNLIVDGAVAIKLGSGNDFVGLGNFDNSSGYVDSSINDLISALTVKSGVNIQMAGGNNLLVAKDVTVNGPAGNDFVLTAGNGNDNFLVNHVTVLHGMSVTDNGTATIDSDQLSAKYITITLGPGNNQVTLEDTTVTGNVAIHTGLGNDVVNLPGRCCAPQGPPHGDRSSVAERAGYQRKSPSGGKGRGGCPSDRSPRREIITTRPRCPRASSVAMMSAAVRPEPTTSTRSLSDTRSSAPSASGSAMRRSWSLSPRSSTGRAGLGWVVATTTRSAKVSRPILRANEPGVGDPANRDDGIPLVPHTPFRQEGAQRLVDVATEVLPARKRVHTAQRSGVLRQDAGRGKPSREMRVVVRQKGHAGRRHVDAVDGIIAAVGEARADARARFEHDKALWDARAREMICHRSAGEAAADDRDRGSRRAHEAAASTDDRRPPDRISPKGPVWQRVRLGQPMRPD